MNQQNIISYNGYLLDLLNNNLSNNQFDNELKLNIYITLLALNNSNYHESIYLDEMNILENFLRKTNNIKIKIQLKRKEEEIDNLLTSIIDIYNDNKTIIDKHNKENLDIGNILNSKNPQELTKLIDKLTKEKMNIQDKKESDDLKRSLISYNIFNNNYYTKDNNLYIEQDNKEPIITTLDEFYNIFEYLIYIKNYPKTYQNEDINNSHISIIENLIDLLKTKEINEDTLIPIVLTNIILKNIPNYETINTTYFNVENIKITDLYSLANQQIINQNSAKWKNIHIPNNYLYTKLKEIITTGEYYYNNNVFILDNKNTFKITITKDNLKQFLKANLENLITY